jgi:hypothetical protein
MNKKKTIVTYRDKEDHIIHESKDSFIRKLANNLQNSYLKSVNFLITRNLENRRDPNKFLDEYDVLAWNKHIYSLSDESYRKKLINQLNLHIQS